MSIRFSEPRNLNQLSDKDSKEEKPKPCGRIEDFEKVDYSFGAVTHNITSAPGKTIATLPINGFIPSTEKYVDIWREVQAGIGQKLSSIADADALIVDLRQNHGGHPDTVGLMLSYLFDGGSKHILDFVDRYGKIENSISTVSIDELPAGTKVFGGKKPLYVLTTEDTISGGEDMAYSLQAFKRAIAVVGEGETTKGAANPIARLKFLCEEEFGEKWWVAGIPSTKPVHPVTGSNWEGVGVMSDVVAGKSEWEAVGDAKEVATRLAVKHLGEQHKDEL